MMPQNVLSDVPVPQAFAPPRDIPPQQLRSYDYGGVAINDSSQGLQVKIWECRWVNGDFILNADGVPDSVIYSAPNVTDLDITFDSNMQPFLAFTQGGVAKYRWYDGAVSNFVVNDLPAGSVTPKCQLDDKRSHQQNISDIILAYVRGGALYFRQQRDRFGVEYLLDPAAGQRLLRMGMGMQWRMVFEMSNV
jgi:hypothetical protein